MVFCKNIFRNIITLHEHKHQMTFLGIKKFLAVSNLKLYQQKITYESSIK